MTNLVQKFNHIGHCVVDLEKTQKFYTKCLEFKHDRDLTVEGDSPAKLLRLKTPMKLKAVYLVREGFVLELLHYPTGTAPRQRRVMNEPGLTHISLNVTNMAEILKRVPTYGGKVLEDTNLGAAAFIEDPEGQLIELIQAR